MPIVRFLEGRGFDADQTQHLGAAFNAAWQVLKTKDPALANGPLTVAARELLAKIIVEAGQRGEKDQARLVAHALDRFGEDA